MSNNFEKKISFLDWGLTIAFLVLILAIYLPSNIHIEESYFKNKSRHRMRVIYAAEEYYRELTGHYTLDGEHLINLVQQARDSLMGDSLFYGEKIIHIDGIPNIVNISPGFEFRVDTTFSDETLIKIEVEDIILTVGMINEETNNIDTIYVNKNHIEKFMADSLFNGIYAVDTSSHSEVYSDYTRLGFRLTSNLLQCPLTHEKYLLKLDESDPEMPVFTVTSPVPAGYSEPRFLYLYRFKADNHGFISDGRKSWKSS